MSGVKQQLENKPEIDKNQDNNKSLERSASKEALEERQNAEKQKVTAKHLNERTTVAEQFSSQRAEIFTSGTLSSSESTESASKDTTSEQTSSSDGATDEGLFDKIGKFFDDFKTSSLNPFPKIGEFFKKITGNFEAIISKITETVSSWFGGKKDEDLDKGAASGLKETAKTLSSKTRYSGLERPADADPTWGLEGSALFNHPLFKAKTKKIADNLGGGITVEDFYSIFMMECGGKPQRPLNPIGAAGLIQWIPSTAQSMYKLSTRDIQKMSGLQQLDLVEKYFAPYRGRLRTFSDLYRVVFYPASLGKPTNWVFGSERKDSEWRIKVATQNPAISKFGTKTSADGKVKLIDNRAFEAYCNYCRNRNK